MVWYYASIRRYEEVGDNEAIINAIKRVRSNRNE